MTQPKRRKWTFGPVKPKPQDLTEEKILMRMSCIQVGDIIRFDSIKECYAAEQLDRHSMTIKADGKVTEVCGGYVMVRLRRGVIESVNYFDIEMVNGHGFPGYIKRVQSTASLASLKHLKEQLWN